MGRNQVRTRIVTGCLMTMLLPVGALLAQTVNRPTFTFGVVPGFDPGEGVIRPAPGPAGHDPVLPVQPWFRETFVLVRSEGTFPTTSFVGLPPPDTPATAEPATRAVQPPGVVENLRRTDHR